MAVKYNTSVITDGLVFSLDAANKKSYNFNENLLTYSQEFDNIIWSKSNSAITTNQAIAPDNTVTADLWIPNVTSDSRLTTQSAKDNGIYTLSFYAKSAGLTVLRTHMLGRNPTDAPSEFVVEFNLSTGTSSIILNGNGISTSIQSIGNGWFRCICSYTKSGASTDLETRIGQYNTGDGISGFYFWGAQLEKSYTANTYVPTTSSISSGSITWLDLSGNGSNGTVTSGPIYSNTNAGVMTFDGTNDFIDVANNSFTRFPHDQAWSFSMFCKPVTQNTTFPGFIILGNSVTSGILIFYTADGIYWKHNNLGTYITTRDLNVVKNITLTYSGSGNVLAYVNGTLVQNLPTMVSTDTTSNFLMGRGDQFGNVDIYNFMKYNRQLSASEVLSNFNAMRGRYGL